MSATTALRDTGQRLWLDTISRRLLESGTRQRYLDDYGDHRSRRRFRTTTQ